MFNFTGFITCMDTQKVHDTGTTHDRIAKLHFYETTGFEMAVEAFFRELQSKPLGSSLFKEWIKRFKNDRIGNRLRFFVDYEQYTVEFYSDWPQRAIAKISYVSINKSRP